MKRILMLFSVFLLISSFGISQVKQITGTVTNKEDGLPMAGVTVAVKGTTLGVVTNPDGKYSISVSDNQTLTFTFVGMKSQDIPVAGKTTIDVVLVSDLMNIEEIVVIAYGTTTKSSYTGSADMVKSDKIAKIQTASASKALEGVAAGVQVTGGTGQPGSSASIRIRGIGSVNASSAPLYVVDGAPYDGNLNSINTNDIESISVLKDATSAALYGARGANGVIMITTKKGTVGRSIVNLKASVGQVSRAVPEYDRVGPKDYYELMWEGWTTAMVKGGSFTPATAAAAASGNTTNGIVNKLGGYNSYDVANDQLIGLDGKLNPNAKLLYYDDWNKNLAQKGLRQDYNLSMSGGNEKSRYFASVTYLDEEGMVKWSNYKRFTGRVGAESKVNKWLKMDASLSGSTSKQMGFVNGGTATTNPFYFGRMMGPIYPIWQRDNTGAVILDGNGNPMFDLGGGTSIYKWAGHTRAYAPNSNLMLTLPLDERSTALNSVSARVGAEIKFLKDFTLRVTGNNDISNYFYTTYQNYLFADAEAVKGRSTKEYRKVMSYTFNQVLTWNRSFNQHKVSLLAGHENYLYNWQNVTATRTGFTIPTTQLVAASVAEGSNSYEDNYALEGYFFRGEYNFSDKYFFSGSYRTDGSSRFFKDARWGSFWSVGGSWRLSQEPFLKSILLINDLKLKASYGVQGNDDIGTFYGWQSLFALNNNNGNYNGALHSQLENKTLKWEKNGNLNVGVEFGLINRITGSFEYFIRNSSNLLFNVPLPQSTGLNSKLSNIGSMSNKGFELTLAFDIIKKGNLNWNLQLNATSYKNKITKMPLGSDGKPQEIVTGVNKRAEGHSIYDFWLRGWAGVDSTDGSALFYKQILNTDGTPTGRDTITKDQNAASYYYYGSSIPKVYGGITNTISYKGFEISALVSYQIGGKIYDSNWAALMHTGAFGSNWSTDILRRWRKPGDVTDVPRLQNNYTAGTAASARYLIDASFLSLRNITISYKVPSKLLKSLDISELSIFASGDNLGMICKRKGMDPQQSFGGTTDFTYVPSRVMSFGINLTF